MQNKVFLASPFFLLSPRRCLSECHGPSSTKCRILSPPKYTSFVPRSRGWETREVRFAVDKAALEVWLGASGPWFRHGVRCGVLFGFPSCCALGLHQGVVLPPSFLLPSFLRSFSFLPSYSGDHAPLEYIALHSIASFLPLTMIATTRIPLRCCCSISRMPRSLSPLLFPRCLVCGIEHHT